MYPFLATIIVRGNQGGLSLNPRAEQALEGSGAGNSPAENMMLREAMGNEPTWFWL